MNNQNYGLNLQGYKAELSDKDFGRLSNFIMSEYGIKMPPEKKIMLQSRLIKRLKALDISDFKKYVDYVFSPEGQEKEIIHMMDVVSTNKTDFFREPVHFDFLLDTAMPTLMKTLNPKILKIWSAGCSSGEEPYSVAITMSEFLSNYQGTDFHITSSDISTNMLKKAVNAVYTEEKAKDIPLTLKRKYLLRSKDPNKKLVRIIPDLRSKITFYRQNLLELTPAHKAEYHLIFCRNVLIYFNRETQYKILSNLCTNLIEGGYLFVGHSESIFGYELPLVHQIPTVYQKT